MAYISDQKEWRRITGQTATIYSTFYLEGQGRIGQISGYVDAPGLIQSLLKIVVRVGTLLYNRRHHDPEIGSIAEVGRSPRESVSTSELIQSTPPELSKLIEDIRRIRSEIEQVKNGNIIEKAFAAKRLKTDIESVKTDAKAAADELRKEFRFTVDGVKNRVESVKIDLSLLKGEKGRLAQIEAGVRLAKNGLQDLEEGKHIRDVITSEFRKNKEDGEGWSDQNTTHSGIFGIITLLSGVLWKLRRGKEDELSNTKKKKAA